MIFDQLHDVILKSILMFLTVLQTVLFSFTAIRILPKTDYGVRY